MWVPKLVGGTHPMPLQGVWGAPKGLEACCGVRSHHANGNSMVSPPRPHSLVTPYLRFYKNSLYSQKVSPYTLGHGPTSGPSVVQPNRCLSLSTPSFGPSYLWIQDQHLSQLLGVYRAYPWEATPQKSRDSEIAHALLCPLPPCNVPWSRTERPCGLGVPMCHSFRLGATQTLEDTHKLI